jgi:hypothetical protein
VLSFLLSLKEERRNRESPSLARYLGDPVGSYKSVFLVVARAQVARHRRSAAPACLRGDLARQPLRSSAALGRLDELEALLGDGRAERIVVTIRRQVGAGELHGRQT